MGIRLLVEVAQANKAASKLMAEQDFVAAKQTVSRAQALLEVASVHYASPKTELQNYIVTCRRQQANMLKANLGPGSTQDTASAPVRPLCLIQCNCSACTRLSAIETWGTPCIASRSHTFEFASSVCLPSFGQSAFD